MKKMTRIVFALAMFFLAALPGPAAGSPKGWPDEKTAARGIREALEVGSGKAVEKVSRTDGFFGNDLIRIPIPEKLHKAEKLLRKTGHDKLMDDFLLSMNRAAETAAPHARDIFSRAIRDMTLGDALAILRGNDSAATDYFREHTAAPLATAFRPVVATAMDEVGATRNFKTLMKKVEKLPLAREKAVDLDGYVTGKALAGIFTMLAEEEKKIRKDPAARVTDLLRRVFSLKEEKRH